jgi:hypothetical protein
MENGIKKVHSMATTAIEALMTAFQENPDYNTSGFILAALAMVTQMREEVVAMGKQCDQSDPAEYCFPV